MREQVIKRIKAFGFWVWATLTLTGLLYLCLSALYEVPGDIIPLFEVEILLIVLWAVAEIKSIEKMLLKKGI